MIKDFKQHIDTNFSFLHKSKILIAVSGGLDSVVLTHLCKASNLNIALAHCNFKLRGEESDGDEAFVLQLGETLNVEVFIEYFDTEAYAENNKLSIQMAARELRYQWFESLMNHLEFDYMLTAHHADDNLETFLINLSRGSGLRGLTGIPEINGQIVRPLLPFSREQLAQFAENEKISWRDDSSNASDTYLRNKLRHHIIPNLKDIAPELLDNVKTTISNLNDAIDIVDESVNSFESKAITDIDEYKVKYKISKIKKLKNPKAYLFEMFKAYGFSEWNDIEHLLEAQSGKQVLSKTHRLLKDRKHLILTLRQQESGSDEERSFGILENEASVETSMGILFFDEADAISKPSETTIYVDKDQLKFPLQLRKWKKGDVFYPLGMQGKKKLSKYFKDEKMSLIEKERVCLLLSDENIVWVIGKRADERFKVTKATKQILRITLKQP